MAAESACHAEDDIVGGDIESTLASNLVNLLKVELWGRYNWLITCWLEAVVLLNNGVAPARCRLCRS